MNQQNQSAVNQLGTVADEALSLITATADIAGEKVCEARKRLAAALDSGKVIAGRVRDKAVEQAKVADHTIRENPYQSIAIGVALEQ
ncbi:MAG: hypothetical protein IPK15_21180 [Verrucomicrobia bacterium]|nr:hypothetical protein [Verrucomicrobiota bacterium]